MDRISNKFKLVRSQSIGVGMGGEAKSSMAGPGGGGGGVTRAPVTEGRTAQIILLDERRVELQVQRPPKYLPIDKLFSN